MSERMTDEMIEDLATALNHGAAIDAGEILDALVAEREEVERLRAELAAYREEEATDEIAYAEYRAAQHRIAEALGFCASWHLDIEFLLRVERAVEAMKAERDKWQRIRTPTHGACCTCQRCGQIYDECRCDLDETADELARCKAELAALRARCERRDGDPTAEQLRLLADPAWVEPSDAMGHCRMMTARVALRAWGVET